MKARITLLLLFLCLAFTQASAKFIQEVELQDGTILSGYIYRQVPGKFMVFSLDKAIKDPRLKYLKTNLNYTLQWRDVRSIRRSPLSDPQWCNDKVTLKNGIVYEGQIIEQELGVGLRISCSNGSIVYATYQEISDTQKVAKEYDSDLWFNRQYTNRVRLNDKSWREGLIVRQHYDASVNNCYIEVLHSTGNTELIYIPDIKEFYVNLIEN